MRWTILILWISSFPAFAMHFNLKSQINDGPGAGNLLIGDTDRDGKPELIFYSCLQECGVNIYEFDGGTWENTYSIGTGFLPVYGLGLLDSDSLYDLWLQHYDTLCLFESPTPYSFPIQKVWTSPYNGTYNFHYQMDMKDMDNDGKIDIVDAGEGPFSTYNLCIYENNGDNSFDIVFYDTTLIVWGSRPALCDYDGDGKMEIAIGTLENHALFIENTGDNSYELCWEMPLSSLIDSVPVGYLLDVFACPDSLPDMDGDGKREVVFHPKSTSAVNPCQWREDVVILEADGDNSYRLSWYDSLPGYSWSGSWPPGHNLLRSTIADIDGDTTPEILLSVAHKVYILKATSNDNYQLAGEIYLTPLVGAPMDEYMDELYITAWDLDNNGLNEIITGIVYEDNQHHSHKKILIFEKGIDLQWIYPNSTDTLTANSSITLKWNILDHYAVDSCFIFLSSPYNPQNKQLIFSGSPSDTSFTWTVPDSLGWFKLMLLATGPGIPPRRDSIFSSPFFILTDVKENQNLPLITHGLSVKPSNPASLPLSICFYMDRPEDVRLYVVDVSGRVLKRFRGLRRGYNEVRWSGEGEVCNGVYYVVLEVGGERHIRRVVLVQ